MDPSRSRRQRVNGFVVCAIATLIPICNCCFLRDTKPIISAATFIPNLCIKRRGAFVNSNISPSSKYKYSTRLHYLSMNSGDNDDTENDFDNNDDSQNNAAVPDELSWRLAKVRLEEANTKRFLKSRPIKLSYKDSQKWIQRNWAPNTKEEFEDLVANGNLRTPYISKRPEEYYGRRGEWISWDDYLLGDSSESDEVEGGGQELKWQ